MCHLSLTLLCLRHSRCWRGEAVLWRHRRRPPPVPQGALRQGQGRRLRGVQGERDCLLGGVQDVLRAAHHVAWLPVGVHLRALGGVPVEEVYPLHQAEGLCPVHRVSKLMVQFPQSSPAGLTFCGKEMFQVGIQLNLLVHKLPARLLPKHN